MLTWAEPREGHRGLRPPLGQGSFLKSETWAAVTYVIKCNTFEWIFRLVLLQHLLPNSSHGASIKKLACAAIYAPEVFELLSSLPPSLPGLRVVRRKVTFYLLLMLDTWYAGLHASLVQYAGLKFTKIYSLFDVDCG